MLYTIAVPLRAASSPVIAHLVLAFPHGRLRSRWERLLVTASYVVVLGLGVLGLLFSDDPRDLLAISADHEGSGVADRVLGLAATVISAGVIVVLLYRWLTGRLPQRRLLFAGDRDRAVRRARVRRRAPRSVTVTRCRSRCCRSTGSSFCLWPLAFLAGVLRARVGNAEMIRLLLERDGTGLAALVQDDEVWKDSRSIDALNAAAGLVLDNQRLTAELEQRLAEVRASRARLVAAGDEERRRLERDLHDGAQQRLVSVVLLLRMADRRHGAATGGPRAAEGHGRRAADGDHRAARTGPRHPPGDPDGGGAARGGPVAGRPDPDGGGPDGRRGAPPGLGGRGDGVLRDVGGADERVEARADGFRGRADRGGGHRAAGGGDRPRRRRRVPGPRDRVGRPARPRRGPRWRADRDQRPRRTTVSAVIPSSPETP